MPEKKLNRRIIKTKTKKYCKYNWPKIYYLILTNDILLIFIILKIGQIGFFISRKRFKNYFKKWKTV